MLEVKKSKNELLDEIIKRAYKEGDFLLASGKKSSYYIDCKEVTLDPYTLNLIANIIYDEIKNWNVVAVGGPELGAVPISTAISMISLQNQQPLRNIIIRKESKQHGATKKIEGQFNKNDKIAIVEDVVSTGGSSSKAIEAVKSMDMIVAGIFAIVDRNMGGEEAFKKKGIKYKYIFSIDDLRNYKRNKQ